VIDFIRATPVASKAPLAAIAPDQSLKYLQSPEYWPIAVRFRQNENIFDIVTVPLPCLSFRRINKRKSVTDENHSVNLGELQFSV